MMAKHVNLEVILKDRFFSCEEFSFRDFIRKKFFF
jgi:hypothetical protein